MIPWIRITVVAPLVANSCTALIFRSFSDQVINRDLNHVDCK